MKVLISGVCGFVGSTIARLLVESGVEVHGVDNFVRMGSETNRSDLVSRGVKLTHGDIRLASDLDGFPALDWVIDAAALPSVLAGVDGTSSSRQLVEHNLLGTLNLLEYCQRHQSGFVLLSTSRVYSIAGLSGLPLQVNDDAYCFDANHAAESVTAQGLSETFSTSAPVSMYGATKLASETMALEYGSTYGFPVWINRCGVIAGAGQFGRADQGIFSFWLHSHLRKRSLRYIGFGGTGYQVRDCLHPHDLARLVYEQLSVSTNPAAPSILNVSGGIESAMSLRQLTEWCDQRFGAHLVEASDEHRPFDLPWVVLDSHRARETWGWKPELTTPMILEEIAKHAEMNPGWLELSR